MSQNIIFLPQKQSTDYCLSNNIDTMCSLLCKVYYIEVNVRGEVEHHHHHLQGKKIATQSTLFVLLQMCPLTFWCSIDVYFCPECLLTRAEQLVVSLPQSNILTAVKGT